MTCAEGPGRIVVGAVMLSPSLLVPAVTLWVFPGWPSLHQEAQRPRAMVPILEINAWNPSSICCLRAGGGPLGHAGSHGTESPKV